MIISHSGIETRRSKIITTLQKYGPLSAIDLRHLARVANASLHSDLKVLVNHSIIYQGDDLRWYMCESSHE